MAAVSSWSTPSLATVRANNKAYIEGRIGDPLIPNDVPRVLADANAGNAHLNLQYLDWQANQLLPDTAQKQFLDKWATIYLVNADGSKGRKAATYASGTISVVASVAGTVLPAGSILTAMSTTGGTLSFQSTAATSINTVATPVPVRALVAGAASNLAAGTSLSLSATIPGINTSPIAVVSLSGGTDQESDAALRVRVLFRIQQPPMGGDASDYVAWATGFPGVTRAWCSPLEQGVGTVTLRFMMDELRATSDPMTSGFPLPGDVAALHAYLETVRPVTAGLFTTAPIPEPISFTVANLAPNTTATQAAIATSAAATIVRRASPAYANNGVAQPAQTIYAAWISDAVLAASGVFSFDLQMADHVMPTKGSLAVPGPITFG